MVRISNLELLLALRENSRTPFVGLAKRFGVSETAIRKRVRKLEQDGVIKKYTIEVDTRKIGYDIDALIGVDTRPEDYMDALEKMRKMKDVKCMCSSSGDHMILLECWFHGSAELTMFLKKLKGVDGVTKICPAIKTETIK
ncbi:MAG: Lrp/AsnC family transcriptional regulator [Candidatus Aenigmarchaeota archaeon]|nr:Lrp/AsnC family transcriptional regulator [Candidatus Aenigmarchaeota archaeon]